MSESRDPEEVRELLSGYFDLARSLIGRYGGTVQKFIGDAVMAVWGAPIAREDDAERAVRAALELVSGISTFGDQHGIDLEARVGVATGEAATTETPDEGMVIGDRVNTASRIQSVARPRSCFVDETTRNATAAAVVYRDAGDHELRGKTERVHLFEAIRVVAGIGGALKSRGLEAPFVGRDGELRLVKELFHTSAEQSRAHLVSIVGVAGIGKTRLAWEYFKYIDGISDVVLWHRGRCLAYGDGVTYWALAEMVRSRARIVEGEDATEAAAKLHRAVEEYVPDEEERRWVESRLAQLLGVETRGSFDREDLFAGWRMFFEQMAAAHPVVLSFEDMQWADSALLDFVEYLLEWSRSHAIFVMMLTRPELLERRPNFGTAHRNFTSISLEPLADLAMRALIDGLVPGLPDGTRDQILGRAGGVPLYAVETVRMLIDRGLLVSEETGYRPVGPIEVLDIPETLHALIAARLDGLNEVELRVIQEAAVLGKSFTKEGVSRLSGVRADELAESLDALVRKELIAPQMDPRSTERGHYSFLQDIVRTVAYESLSKRDRKLKHLAAAAYLEDAFGSEDDEVLEVVEIVASHYRSALELSPTSADADQVRAKARSMTVRAGERAAALADARGAQRYFEQALELTDEELEQASLEERAGLMATQIGDRATARTHFERAISLLDLMGETHAGARVAAQLGEIDFHELHMTQGIERMEKAFALLSEDEPDADLATLAAQLGRLQLFSGSPEIARQRIEFALALAEKLELPEQFSQALNTKAVILEFQQRPREAMLLIRHALSVALSEGFSVAALRAYNNLLAFLLGADKLDEMTTVYDEAMDLAQRIGHSTWQMYYLGIETIRCVSTGEWDRALELVEECRQAPDVPIFLMQRLIDVTFVHVNRGDLAAAREMLAAGADLQGSEEVQSRATYSWASSLILFAEGRLEEALAAADDVAEVAARGGDLPEALINQLNVSFEADPRRCEEILRGVEAMKPGEKQPSLRAHAGRIRAKMSPDVADENFEYAIGIFRRIPARFWLAVSLLEQAESLGSRGHAEDAAVRLAEAGAIFEGLRAAPWIERVHQASAGASNRAG